MTSSISQATEKINTLIRKFEGVKAEGKESEFNEERVKLQFINDFLEALGWDVSGKTDLDEVKPEQRTLIGRVDFSLRVNGGEKIFFEIKKFSEDLSGYRTVHGRRESFEEQAINYAWHRKVDWAVLTNFKETRLYYTHVKKPREGLIFKLRFDQYLDNIAKLWLLSKESVTTRLLDTYEKRRTRRDIDIEVLEDLFNCRKLLAKDIYGKYRGVETERLKESIQRILDRLIVIRFMEDKGIETADRLWKEWTSYRDTVRNKEAISFMNRLRKNVFEEFNEIYNSKIFEPHQCDTLAVDNAVLKTILQILYKYNFNLIDADVLGNIYEDYLGHVLEEKGREVEIVEKHEKRKAHGIYYTPTYVVDYIVRNTVGALIEEKKKSLLGKVFQGRGEEELDVEEKKRLGKKLLNEINKIKILDPACGSGSFLIKAFDVIKEYYDAYGEDSNGGVMTPEKRILLNNLYGVDLDPQATEIASVNLMLKALRQGQKLPLILDENIKRGNSLISGTEEELRKYFDDAWKEKKPFNWKEEFPEVFENGGFDVVIGNPPYYSMYRNPTLQKYCKEAYSEFYAGRNDVFYYFILKALDVLKNKRFLGFITSRYWLEATFAENLRKFILDNSCIVAIIDFGNLIVFKNVGIHTCIVILKKEEDVQKRNENIFSVIKVVIGEDIGELFKEILKSNVRSNEKIKVFSVKQRTLSPQSWNLIPLEEEKLLKKINDNRIKLGEISYIGKGLQTAANEIFILDERSLKEHKIEKDVTKRVIEKGTDFRRYYSKYRNKYILYVTNETDITRYPRLRRYLEKNREVLEQRYTCREESTKWYSLSRYNEALFKKFKEKIVTPYRAPKNTFAYNDKDYGSLTDTYVIVLKDDITLNLKYILALINSKILDYYSRTTGRKKGEIYEYLTDTLSKIPIPKIDFSNPSEKAKHNDLVALADKMLTLNKQYHEALDAFNKILANLRDEETKERSFKDYYSAGSNYGINLIESKKLVEMKGKVTKIEVREEGSDLIFNATYIPGEKENGIPISDNALKVRIDDKVLRKFFYYAIKTTLVKSKKKVYGRGNISEVILKAIKIPRFSNLMVKDVEKIRGLMEEFFKASPIGDKNLCELEDEIKAIDKTIDEKVYELYDLTPEEIKIVEGAN